MLKVVKPRCEYKKNPIGIDVLKPRLSWQIQSDSRNVMQGAYNIQVSTDESFESIIWDTGKVASDQSVHLKYEGQPVQSRTRYYYRVMVWDQKGNASSWSETAFWEMGLLDTGEWKAEWITAASEINDKTVEASPMLRKVFKAAGDIKSARIYATGLGLYEIHLNGSRVGDFRLTPGWTSYNKRLQYQTYDITELLKDGENAVGIMLGNGWYKGELAWSGNRSIYGNVRAALMQMHITYADGSEDIIASDAGWKASTGPVLMSELYHGETYDARLEKTGWSTAGYDDSGWETAVRLEHAKDMLCAQENVPVKVIEEIKPIDIISTPSGETVIDMGQNMVGWVRIKVRGEAGSEVVLQHAEVLDREGNFYTDNLRAAKQTIRYILKGSTEEVFEPHFTFQGFRYVKVVSFPGKPSLDNFTGMVVHSDMEQTGTFTCSDELINQLQHNILWGQKGNFVDVPTDCPQRDERLGWTGDAQVFVRTASFNMNTAPFFAKWLGDLAADQLPNGGVPFVIPQVLDEKSHSSAAWGDAAVIIPWTIYLCYGDESILEQRYESMKAWVEYIRKQGDNEYLWNTGFHFGDWLGLDAKEDSYVGATATDYIATAYYAYSTNLLAKTAEVIGREKDAKEYSELYMNIVSAFRKEFVTPNGRLSVPTQTAHVVALMFDLLEEKDKERTINTLIRYLEESKYHLNTGFVGTPYLCYVLSKNGHNEAAYKLVRQTDYPSWLYQITKGATTIWEHWDGIKEDGSFWSRDMNSFNHYAYGSIGDWLYRIVAGLDADEDRPGYKHINIAPQPGEGLTSAQAVLQSMYGEIKSAWKEENGRMTADITVPPNTTATVVLPFAQLEEINEGGTEVRQAKGVNECRQADGGVKLELGSGEYSFSYNIIKQPVE